MKRIFIIYILSIAAISVKAQPAVGHGRWEENTHSKSRPVPAVEASEFSGVEISVENKIVTFTDVPESKKTAWAVVTDANGEVITQKRLTPQSNYIDLRRQHKGELYFITLMYRSKSQKGFVVHL